MKECTCGYEDWNKDQCEECYSDYDHNAWLDEMGVNQQSNK